MPGKIHKTYDDIHSLSILLSRKIKEDGFNPDKIIALSRGGLLPGVIMSHLFNVPMIALNWSTRDFIDTDVSKLTELFYEEARSMKEAQGIGMPNFLIVDDICDTGETFTNLSGVINSILEMSYNNMSAGSNIFKSSFKFSAIYERHTNTFDLDYYSELLMHDDWIIFPFEGS